MEHSYATGALLVEAVRQGAATLEKHAETINSLNVFPVPDGDTGTNMLLTVRAALEQLEASDPSSMGAAEAAKAVSRGVLLGARGNSGVILSQFVRGFAEGAAGKAQLGPKDVAEALEQATAFAYRAVIRPVEGTMLTVGKGASSAARAAADSGADLAGVLQAAWEGASRELERTPDLLPVLKRAGVVDAGGKGLVCFLQGARRACAALHGHEAEETGSRAEATAVEPASPVSASFEAGNGSDDRLAELHRNLDPADIAYRYCTEFLIKGRDLSVDVIRARLLDLGDSLLVVGDDEVVKVHLHTENPGRALEIGVAWGDLANISIDNMRQQQQETARAVADASAVARGAGESGGRGGPDPSTGAGATSLQGGGPVDSEPLAPVGVVAVAPGDGWEQLLSSLGAGQVVRGGQTMNPSAAELLAAIEAVAAREVVVLPNNGNIIFAARQARQLTTRPVHIVETTSPSAGVAALLAFNPFGTGAEAASAMEEAAGRVRTGEVTRAVRDSGAWADGIKTGDRIGVVEGDIKVVAPDEERAVLQTLEHLLDEETSFISIYYGEDVDDQAAERTAEAVRSAWPRCEVELVRGGQPVYTYLLSAE